MTQMESSGLFGNTTARRMFRHGTKEVAGEERSSDLEELPDVYYSPNIADLTIVTNFFTKFI
jgi:hypothetical protein